MSGSMRFGSVCSGIEAASVAWHPLGWKAAWLSEIEKFPCAVLAHHYPDVPNLGDMTTLPDRIRSGEVEAPDIFCGGTPCQAFSVAGLRKSLDDARGNLSLTFCEIADAIDQVRLIQQSHPSIVFWENVPGVLNTKDNAFGCFLGALAGEDDALVPPGGRWTNAGFIDGPQRAVAWRVLDAQYFGVAQRRRRVFVIASARDDFDPAAVLFEFEGLRRDTAPSREKRQSVAGYVESSFGQYRKDNIGGTSKASGGVLGGGSETFIAQPIALAENTIGRQPQNGGNGDGFTDGGPMYTLNATGVHGVAQPVYEMHGQDSRVRDLGDTCSTVTSKWGTGGGNVPVTTQPIPLNTMTMQGRPSDDGRMGSGIGEPGDPAPTLTKAHSHAVAQPMAFTTEQTPKYNHDQALTLTKSESKHNQCVMQAMAVRRLTPVECERLQGFPDNYTKIADKTPDGPRYKALGNSWAVPVVRWIGERIARAT